MYIFYQQVILTIWIHIYIHIYKIKPSYVQGQLFIQAKFKQLMNRLVQPQLLSLVGQSSDCKIPVGGCQFIHGCIYGLLANMNVHTIVTVVSEETVHNRQKYHFSLHYINELAWSFVAQGQINIARLTLDKYVQDTLSVWMYRSIIVYSSKNCI